MGREVDYGAPVEREAMSSSGGKSYVVEVVGGDDDKASVHVGSAVVTVGRARDADLALKDPTVSRHHVQLVATEDGVQFAVCGPATRVSVDGRPLKQAVLRIGQTLVVGKTSLRVRPAVAIDQSTASALRTDVTGLLTGAIGDSRGLADLHALIESLDRADDEEALGAALQEWTTSHDVASRVELVPADPKDAPGNDVIERREGDDLVIVSVPVVCERPGRLSFTMSRRVHTDSRRRTLVVAGRVFGSALERARRLAVAAHERDLLRSLRFGSARAFLGTSKAARDLAGVVPRLAASDVSVLLDGESGVGKTFFARLIHEGGTRAREPLRVLNCAAIPETLLESELFGHERGAFTGAAAARVGALESAGGGTLFLDEIAELSLASQAKLLRALEEKRFERLGSNRTLELRARVLSATNRDLAAMTADGRFRSDLLFRIAVVKVTIPPLRDRGDDLLLLAQQILRDAMRDAPRRIDGFSDGALAAIKRYPWPGNVRELRNAIEHAVVMGDTAVIEPSDLPDAIHGAPAVQPSDESLVRLPARIDVLEARAIQAALRATGGHQRRAAALLGISRNTLHRKLHPGTEGPPED
jgi:two-component system, NtrC family, response regulator HydG